MFKNCIKEDLKQVAEEFCDNVPSNAKVSELKELILKSKAYENDKDFVLDYVNSIVSERKSHEETSMRTLEIEKIKMERIKLELELSKTHSSCNSSKSLDETESDRHSCSLDVLIKSIKTLTINVPRKPESWGFFFSSLERAFVTKNVPDNLKAEILLNLLGERASNIIVYIKDDEINNYEVVKSIVLREFEPTAQACLENFRKAQRINESHVQFASRLSTNLEYYLKLRKVTEFETLKQLIVSDKIFQTLDKETAAHISIKQGESWFAPTELAKQCDLFFTSRGKPLNESNFVRGYKNTTKVFLSDSKPAKDASKVFLSDVRTANCAFCNEAHFLANCQSYLKLSVQERVEFVKNKKLCFCCLNPHLVSNCRSKINCFCRRRHHKSLHFPRINTAESEKESFSSIRNKNSKGVALTIDSNQTADSATLNANAEEFVYNEKIFMSSFSNKKNTVLLSTAVCYLMDEAGNKYKVKCLLDVGSESNFLSSDLTELLRLKRERANVLVSGINDISLTIKFRVNASICNEDNSFIKNLDFLVVPRISTGKTPSNAIDISGLDFSNVNLADNNFNLPEKAQMLLGAEIFYELLRPGQIRINNSNLILQNTVFGFVVSGKIPTEGKNRIHCGLIRDETNLDKTLRKFWEIESLETEKPQNKETLICEEHFAKTFTRDESGRYVVKMPLKEDPVTLGSSRQIASKKLNSLWNRLAKEPEYLKLYSDFLKEYQQLGHMIEIHENEEEKGSYYIPHLGVYRGLEKSKSTPLRVVFNASSLTPEGKSLNSIQYNGGVIQEDLLSIMLRFRKHSFAFTADIKKMYRAIAIHPDQRKLQRILWKESLHEPIKTFELTTVTYGTTSAPFLAMRTLRQLALDEGKRYPAAAVVLENDFYMDDVLSGSDCIESAKALQRELIEILGRGGMVLHKWCSNNAELAVNSESYPCSYAEETKTLGVIWKSREDCFAFKVSSEDIGVTKRQVLSTIARIFDPLGILGPMVARAKIFLQRLWLLELNWDDHLPTKEKDEWLRFSSALQFINSVRVERCILLPSPVLIEIHGFADASEVAYGAVIYCKSQSKTGEVSVKLVASKSRVSPLKRLTIPKLELCAAVLLSKLVVRVISALKLNITNTYLWSDSMIVLCWLQKEPCHLKTFVANRVASIQAATKVNQWRHVSSHNNPADLISRGVDPDKLSENSLWWNGPEFLTGRDYPEREIPSATFQNDFSDELAFTNSSDSNCFSVFNSDACDLVHSLINISNNYCKVIRILSYGFRFIRNCREKCDRKRDALDSGELRNTEVFILKQVQGESFAKDINSLKKKGEVNQDSQLKSLHPFLDERGLIRVGGRLSNSELCINKKYPIVLPSKSKVTRMILNYYHMINLHLGAQSLLFHVRQKYWPLNGRTNCREVVHKCVTCFKVKPVSCEQLMGSLPKERITANYPFNCTGVDFTGPFLIKYKNQRKGNYQKVYVSLFICFVTKCIHLELVTELSSQAFIATLKRFFARRGKCSKLFSDNATNFVGSHKELKRLHSIVKSPDDKLSGYLSSEGIEWKFLPPRAPNFGGLWEAGVRSFKHHFKRVVGNSKLTYEEFLTLTTQIEGILNSRPLVPLTTDVDDLNALTPGHFLIGRPITSIVEPNLVDIPDSRLKIWQKLTKMSQIIWKKWSNDYLSNLQQRRKWFFEKNNVKIGDLVIIKEDNMAVSNWPLGRIVGLFPGNDGRVRVVAVKTRKGIFKRSISKVCLLPIEE